MRPFPQRLDRVGVLLTANRAHHGVSQGQGGHGQGAAEAAAAPVMTKRFDMRLLSELNVQFSIGHRSGSRLSSAIVMRRPPSAGPQVLRARGRRLAASSSITRAAIRSSSVMACQRVAARVPVRRTSPASSCSLSSTSTWSGSALAARASSACSDPRPRPAARSACRPGPRHRSVWRGPGARGAGRARPREPARSARPGAAASAGAAWASAARAPVRWASSVSSSANRWSMLATMSVIFTTEEPRRPLGPYSPAAVSSAWVRGRSGQTRIAGVDTGDEQRRVGCPGSQRSRGRPAAPASLAAQAPAVPGPAEGAWRRIARRTFDQYRADGVSNLAAALTFRSVLSLFPGLIALVALLGVLGQYPETSTPS